jgi:alpha-galactosidase
MRKIVLSFIVALCAIAANAQSGMEARRFSVSTDRSELVLMVGTDGYLYQLGYGAKGREYTVPARGLAREKEFYPAWGNGFITEPALEAVHHDGNTSTDLRYESHTVERIDDNVALTTIALKDPVYQFQVDVKIKSYGREDVIEMWTEISHGENGEVDLLKYASAAPVFSAREYWLTQFDGNYKREATVEEEKLGTGIKVLDSKIGVRAHQMRIPSFILSLNGAAREDGGEVYASTLSWPGSFYLAFDVDWNRNLRAISGINPASSRYTLEPGRKFTTPASTWTYSSEGKGGTSRNLHRWAMRYRVRDGAKQRPILLNNWEATHCDFDQQKIVSLMEGAADVGIELFLLDDGWFGNKYPRDDDKNGLGDWDPDVRKLPDGLSPLGDAARRLGIGFGIWLEPEMVNPRSELFERHPDWVITQAGREPLYGRNQMVLDLTNPAVREFEWRDVIEKTLKPNPGISYVKWDANRYLTQPGSSYLPADRQSHLTVDYNFALLDLMRKSATEFPDVMMMLCSGGSGRTDYGSMRYFDSFWPSDNTDPLKRVFIQWGFSHFFPANTISAHATRMGRRPMKFTIDVAMSGAYGVDIDLSKLTAGEMEQIRSSVELYKRALRPVVQYGDLYRLVSPYEESAAALSYVMPEGERAVVFVYQVAEGRCPAVKLKGLDREAKYRVTELNLASGQRSTLAIDGKRVSGARLMDKGFVPTCKGPLESMVIELIKQ